MRRLPVRSPCRLSRTTLWAAGLTVAAPRLPTAGQGDTFVPVNDQSLK